MRYRSPFTGGAFLAALILLLLVTGWTVTTSREEVTVDMEILKKVARTAIQNSLAETNDPAKSASAVGLDDDQFRRLCMGLDIDLSRFSKPTPEPVQVPTLERFASQGLALDAVLAWNASSPYIIITEKSTHTLFVVEHRNGRDTVVRTYDVKTGRNHGDKRVSGDEKTPEGIYFFLAKYSRGRIEKMVGASNAYQYGDMAFATDFPNSIDRINGKNGSGIWLHGTDEPFESTASNDTRGCVVTTNESIREISEFITLNETPFIIVDTIGFEPVERHESERRSLTGIVEGWRQAWEDEDLDRYIGYYSGDFTDRGRSLSQYLDYKKLIFKAHDVRQVSIENLVMLRHRDSLVARFIQDYRASNLSGTSTKSLYFHYDDGSWRIVDENIRN